MRLTKSLIFTLCLLVFAAAFARALPSSQTEFNTMLVKVMPSVVNIQVVRHPAPNQEKGSSDEPRNLGSGVIMDSSKGYVITNAHVIKGAKLITVTLKDSRKFTGKLIGFDPASDIAVVQINADHLTAIPLANSNNIQVGDFVAAIGSPFGLDQTVTSGIVSALGRGDRRKGNYDSFIQTDAPINLGNSGGALVNMQGELIGMNTAILSTDPNSVGNIGIGFAIPSNAIQAITAQIIQFGSVERGFLGILVQDLTPALADSLNIDARQGALVSIVNQSSPAAEAGITTGDVIVGAGGEPVRSATQLISDVGVLRAGSQVTLSILHQGQEKQVEVNLTSKDLLTSSREEASPYFYGLSMRTYTEFNPSYGDLRGLQVVVVEPDSNARRDGLRPGDVIISANLKPVGDIETLRKIAARQQSKPLLLNILRQGGAFFVVLSPR